MGGNALSCIVLKQLEWGKGIECVSTDGLTS